ncbi:MAG: pyruvate formate-lyase-activating protein [candidate division FCPU426 bacterium]
MKNIIGRVHSVETLGTRDGPGLRCVFFLAGCNFRCQYCQNPDTWSIRASGRMTLAEARARLEPLTPYLRQHGGGVTVSGGEPTLQADFVIGLFKIAHDLKLNTALDTNGSCKPAAAERILAETDVVLLDIKASREALHRSLTGQPLAPVLAFGRQAARVPGRLVLRRVLLPGMNDSAEEIDGLSDYALSLENTPPVELIGYHRLGVHKWRELGLAYPLQTLKPPSRALWARVARKLRSRGLKVLAG